VKIIYNLLHKIVSNTFTIGSVINHIPSKPGCTTPSPNGALKINGRKSKRRQTDEMRNPEMMIK
jgi:hypothetical protein